MLARTVTALVLAASTAGAYYHFLHYSSRSAPFTAIPEKYDLSALPNKTVTFFVSDAGPTQFPSNDSFAAVLSQIRGAAAAWNGVDTSDLRVAFGGLHVSGTAQSTPGGEVLFEDLPPGILGYGGPTAKGDASMGPNGPFVPIAYSVVHLTRDLTKRPGPSYSEAFFLTAVHEMGHALGLQHTMTASTMSTVPTRSTSRAKPIETDDAAGISLLYPARNFASSTGSITGRVTMNGQGVHLASVVGLRQTGSAVSALTSPDGTYRIDGLPPDQYFVYVEALPPGEQAGLSVADLVLPVDATGSVIPPSDPFATVFYPGVKDQSQAIPLNIGSGATTDNINFSVEHRNSVPIYGVTTYSFLNQTAVRNAFFNTNSANDVTLVAQGTGLTAGSSPAPGLGLNVLGGFATVTPGTFRAYGNPPNLAVDLHILGSFAGTGPRHLMFSLGNDIFLRPSGLNLVQNPPPVLSSVSPGFDANGNRIAIVTGSNFFPDTQIFFDGIAAKIQNPQDAPAGRLIVTPPPAPGNYRATITAFNSDGQNSTFWGQTPLTYNYDPEDPPAFTISPSALPAGVESMVEITGTNTNFADEQVTVGFGSNDVFVRRVWVLSPTRALANVSVSPNAPQGVLESSVISGFQVMAQGLGFQVNPPNARLPVVTPALVNPAPGIGVAYPGATVMLSGSNLTTAPNGSTTTVAINGLPATILSASATQISLVIPSGLSFGPAVLRLNNGVDNSFPVVVSIEPPATITNLLSSSNTTVDAFTPARVGESLTASVSGFSDLGSQVAANRARVTVGGVDQPIVSVTQAGGGYQVQFVLANVPNPGQPVSMQVWLDNKATLPITILTRGN